MRPRSSFVASLGYTKTGLKKKMFSQVNVIEKKERKKKKMTVGRNKIKFYTCMAFSKK